MADLLDKIEGPADLKKLELDELPKLAEELRDEIIQTVAQTGGHLASSLGAVELSIALHYVLDSPKDKIVWDVGHQAYAHKLLTGRRDRFRTLRQFEGLSGFPNKDESPHDPFTVGHASTSISQALGLAVARDLNGLNGQVVAVIGDGALTGGMAFEALNHAGQMKKKLIVILNGNEMAISKSVGALSAYLNRILTNPVYNRVRSDLQTLIEKIPKFGPSLLGTAKRLEEGLKGLLVPGLFFEELGFRYFGPIDGHNVGLLVHTLRNVINIREPVLVHVITKKGKGYRFAEESPAEFHSSRPFDIRTGKLKKSPKFNVLTYTEVFGQTMVELASANDKIVAVTAAMTKGTVLEGFAKKFPDRFFDVWIAEQHAVTFASGLAKGGSKPVVAIYSTFLQRAYDQIIHDISLQNLGVVFAIDRAGVVGEDGPTHQGTFDFAYLGHIPNLVVMAPGDERELRDMLQATIDYDGPIAIRYPKAQGYGIQMGTGYNPINIGGASVVREGKDLAIIAIGSMVHPSLEAAKLLAMEGIDAAVINARFLKPLDEDLLERVANGVKFLVTVEEHVLRDGFGALVLEFLERIGRNDIKVKRLALPDCFIPQGPRDLLLKMYGLTAEGIKEAVKAIFAKRV